MVAVEGGVEPAAAVGGGGGDDEGDDDDAVVVEWTAEKEVSAEGSALEGGKGVAGDSAEAVAAGAAAAATAGGGGGGGGGGEVAVAPGGEIAAAAEGVGAATAGVEDVVGAVEASRAAAGTAADDDDAASSVAAAGAAPEASSTAASAEVRNFMYGVGCVRAAVLLLHVTCRRERWGGVGMVLIWCGVVVWVGVTGATNSRSRYDINPHGRTAAVVDVGAFGVFCCWWRWCCYCCCCCNVVHGYDTNRSPRTSWKEGMHRT